MENSEPHNAHQIHSKSHYVLPSLMIGGGLVVASVIAAPYVLPAIGVEDGELASLTAKSFHNSASGAAGFIKNGLSHIPLIGESISDGGWANTVAAVGTSVGGLLLGNFIDKNPKDKHKFKWGKAIKIAGLATSALIAMPMLLTAITTGVSYLANVAELKGLLSYETTLDVADTLYHTTGTVGGDYQHNLVGSGSVAAIVPHFLTCGVSMMTGAASAFLIGSNITESSIAESDKLIADVSEHPQAELSQINALTFNQNHPLAKPQSL